MENVEDLGLGGDVQVDEQVAAGDEVEPRKRRVAQNVVGGEEDFFPDLFPHPVSPVIGHEKAAQPLR